MKELIQITTNEQGSSMVKSARELYSFLEVKSKFADWFKNRVHKYEFVEGRDFVAVDEQEAKGGFSKNLEKPKQGEKGGRPEVDYALSLNMAKELAMVEGNAKGKQARLYFIEKEEQLRKVLTGSAATEQVLIQLMGQSQQILAAHQQLLAGLRSEVDQLKSAQDSSKPRRSRHVRPAHRQPASRPDAVRRGPAEPADSSHPQTGEPISPVEPSFSQRQTAVSTRQAIHQLVADYSAYQGAPVSQTYGYLYKRLFQVHGLSVHQLNRQPTESLLDVLERYRQLDNLYSLALNELTYPHE